MQSCFVQVASELVRVSMALGAQFPLLKITLNRSPASPNRARGVPVYNPVLSLSWGPAEWVAGVQLVDRNGYPVQWVYTDAYKWLTVSLNGAVLEARIVVSDAAYIPKKWTAKRIEKAQTRLAFLPDDVLAAAAEKIATANSWAMSDRRAALLESARCMQDAAAWLHTAQYLRAGLGEDEWVTAGNAGGGDTGGGTGGDTGGGDTGGAV